MIKQRISPRLWFVIDAAWVITLIVFALVGMPIATFHGDEPMQIYMSGDYWVALVDRNINSLMTHPPYDIDTDPQLRILNGSINRYTIGAVWHVAGYSRDQLPPRPGWDWGLSYADNVRTNHRPAEPLLNAARLPSTLFFAFSIPFMFLIGYRAGGRASAYAASVLYALHPVLLLNGRRAMQEGAMLFFGILTVWIAVIIAHRRALQQSVNIALWALLALACGLALTAKHSGIVFVGAALGWIAFAELTHFKLRRAISAAFMTAAAGILAVGLFIALSPALWNDIPARLSDLLNVRAQLIDIQINLDPIAPMTLQQRIEQIIIQPFITPVAHFEVDFWRDDPNVQAEIARYMASPLSGIQFGQVGGAVLTFLAAVGLIICLYGVFWAKDPTRRAFYAGMLAWTLVNIAALLANPLPWQRYYLPFIPAACLLAALGINTAAARLTGGKTVNTF